LYSKTKFFSSRGKLPRIIAYSILVLFLLLFIGKVFYFPVVLIVSTSSGVFSQWSLLVGFAGYLYKPVNQSNVLVCLVEAYSTPCFTGTYMVNGVNGNGRGYVVVPNGNGRA